MRSLIVLCLGIGLLAAGSYATAQAPPRQPQPPGGFPGFPGGQSGHPALDYKEVIPSLIDALKDSDADVRESAASALSSIGSPAVQPLLDIVKDKEKGKDLRANAAYILGRMGAAGSEAMPTLLKLLKDDDKDIRRRAAYAVQRIVKGLNEGPAGGMMPPGMMMPPGGIGGSGRGSSAAPVKAPDPGLLLPSGTAPPVSKPIENDKEKK